MRVRTCQGIEISKEVTVTPRLQKVFKAFRKKSMALVPFDDSPEAYKLREDLIKTAGEVGIGCVITSRYSILLFDVLRAEVKL